MVNPIYISSLNPNFVLFAVHLNVALQVQDHQTQWDSNFVLLSMLSKHHVEKVCTILTGKSNR